MDAETQRFLDSLNAGLAGNGEEDTLTVAQARKYGRELFLALAGETCEQCQVREMAIEGPAGPIPMRLYQCAPYDPPDPEPVVVFFHGGGWYLGDLDCYDNLMRSLCQLTGILFISVDYRLAPEHPYPAGLEDALAALRWAHSTYASIETGNSCIAVMGDSAGGNLATVAAHRLHKKKMMKLAAQFLIYPMLDVSQPHQSFSSRMSLGNGNFFLSRKNIDTAVAHYLPDSALVTDPSVSPLFIDDLEILPHTCIVSASHDPLVDEAREYADKLRNANVPVQCYYYDTIHAFLSFGKWTISQLARQHLAKEVQKQLLPT